jgi:hypothetical protein
VANHGKIVSPVEEKTQLHEAAGALFVPAILVGVIGLAVALGFTFFSSESEFALARFYHAYLVSYAFCLSLSLGGMFFMLVQYLVRAGWSVNVRRVFETFAACLPLMALLGLPLVYTAAVEQKGLLYPWAVPYTAGKDKPAADHAAADVAPQQFADATLNPPVTLLAVADPAHTVTDAAHSASGAAHSAADAAHAADTSHAGGHHETVPPEKDKDGDGLKDPGYHAAFGYYKYDEFTAARQPWLSGWFFSVRYVVYFLVLWLIARHFYTASRRQDQTGDPEITRKLSVRAPVSVVTFALLFTFIAFDLLMTLDHHWYSTIFGVYYFAGSMIATFAAVIVCLNVLQRAGFLTKSVTTEHYHDLGKFMFGFTFFWGYVAFSQFMLQWYASIPEATPWWLRRGVTTAVSEGLDMNRMFGTWSIILLFTHFLIPFPFLLSRWIKRSRELLLLAAVWMLAAHWIDLFWLVMPELNNGKFYFGIPEIGCAAGLIGLFVACAVSIAKRHPLRPLRDPRLGESMGFTNM